MSQGSVFANCCRLVNEPERFGLLYWALFRGEKRIQVPGTTLKLVIEALDALFHVLSSVVLGVLLVVAYRRYAREELALLWHVLGIGERLGLIGLAAILACSALVGIFDGLLRPASITDYGVTGLYAGIVLLIVGLANRSRWSAFDEAEEVSPGNALDGDVVVTGTVEPAGETLETPVEGSKAVCYRLLVDAITGTWSRFGAEYRSTSFYVEAGGERVLVEPEGAWARLPSISPSQTIATRQVTERIEHGEQRVIERMEQPSEVEEGVLSDYDVPQREDESMLRPARIRVFPLQPGDEVTVVGRAERGTNPDGYSTTVVRCDDVERSVVFGGSRDELERGLRLRGRLPTIGGGVLTILSALTLVLVAI